MKSVSVSSVFVAPSADQALGISQSSWFNCNSAVGGFCHDMLVKVTHLSGWADKRTKGRKNVKKIVLMCSEASRHVKNVFCLAVVVVVVTDGWTLSFKTDSCSYSC